MAMLVFKRPDAEIYHEVHGAGHPLRRPDPPHAVTALEDAEP
jgi:hypothetical protein